MIERGYHASQNDKKARCIKQMKIKAKMIFKK
jgi:hypothetical protein